MQKRAGKQSPEGTLFGHVDEIRVQAHGGWDAPPYELTVSFVVQPGVLPAFADDEPLESPAGLAHWLSGRDSAEIAGRLLLSTDDAEQRLLWAALGRAWLGTCEHGASAAEACVSSVAAEVVGSDEYTLEQYRQSERLDLDHLSDPTIGA